MNSHRPATVATACANKSAGAAQAFVGPTGEAAAGPVGLRPLVELTGAELEASERRKLTAAERLALIEGLVCIDLWIKDHPGSLCLEEVRGHREALRALNHHLNDYGVPR